MKRVLCAWEFGGDLGHIRRLAALARALAQQGFEPVLALTDLRHTPQEHLGTCVPAPRLQHESRPSIVSINASDLALLLGLWPGTGLVGPLKAWLALFSRWQPAAVVADFAPGALLAARIAGLPCVNVSSGFSSPLRATPMPSFRTWQPATAPHLAAADARLLDSVNAAFRRLGATPIDHPADVFAADEDLLCTFPDLDPYGERAGAHYFGPLDHGGGGERCAWRDVPGPRVLAYLKPHEANFARVVAALGRVAGDAIVAAPGIAAAEAARLTQGPVRVFANAVALDDVLDGAHVCVGHSGAGFTARALAAGKPMCLLPMHVEQFLIARRVVEARAGVLTRPDEPPPDFDAWLRGLLDDPGYAEGAAKIARRHAGHSGAQASRLAAERIAAICA